MVTEVRMAKREIRLQVRSHADFRFERRKSGKSITEANEENEVIFDFRFSICDFRDGDDLKRGERTSW
jgi:hypothetical protein